MNLGCYGRLLFCSKKAEKCQMIQEIGGYSNDVCSLQFSILVCVFCLSAFLHGFEKSFSKEQDKSKFSMSLFDYKYF